MAEITNRPQGEDAASPTAADTTDTRVVDHLPPSADEAFASEKVDYRPLSLMALVGFLLGVAYVAMIGIGGMVALIGRVPWLLPMWTFFIPLVVLVVCGLARSRIRDSEGVLSGLAFTTWAMRVTVIMALVYAAYYTFTFFAIRLQARDFTDRFIGELKKGNTEQAFALCMGVPPGTSDLRGTIEARFNSTSGKPGSIGNYSRFRQSQFVRYLENAGDQAQIVPMGVASWNYEKGGYQVSLRYQVKTPLNEFEATLHTLGHDSKPEDQQKGRQWQIDFSSGGMVVDPRTLQDTEKGKYVMERMPYARVFAFSWCDKMSKHDQTDAYLDTLPADQRERESKVRRALNLVEMAPVAGVAAMGVAESANRAAKPFEQLLDPKLIHLDEKQFWASRSLEGDIKKRIARSFQPRPDNRYVVHFRLQRESTPRMQERDGRMTYYFDVEVRYMDETSINIEYLVEGQIVVVGQEGQSLDSPLAWRIVGLEMSSGRTPPVLKKEAPRLGGQ